MIARTLNFSRADLLDMEWSETCHVWLPEVARILKEEAQ